jgi:putative glutathione S-transferase
MIMPSLFIENIDNWIKDFDSKFSRPHYIAGHTKTKDDYLTNFNLVFKYLDNLNNKLTGTYIFGDILSIADIIAFTHLCRFDSIYYHLFKLNHKHIRDYNNLNNWMKRLLKFDAFSKTFDVEAAKEGYYLCCYHSTDKLTPFVPLGNGGFELYNN